MVSSLRSSQLEVLIDHCEWHRINVTLEESSLVLSPLGDGFVELGSHQQLSSRLPDTTWNPEKRFVRILKQETQGLGISIQGGAEGGRPIVIRYDVVNFWKIVKFLLCFSKIFPGMPASQTGALYVGDVILAVIFSQFLNYIIDFEEPRS